VEPIALSRNVRIKVATSSACVSSAKCPASADESFASGDLADVGSTSGQKTLTGDGPKLEAADGVRESRLEGG